MCLLKFLEIKSINDLINYFGFCIGTKLYFLFVSIMATKILKSRALFIRVYISSITLKAITQITPSSMNLQNKFSNQISLIQLKFSSSKSQQQSIINLTNYPTILEITSTRTLEQEHVYNVSTTSHNHPRLNKVSATEYSSKPGLWQLRPTTPEDKTSVMHNAFDGISGDFRPANVNRRKKRNRHPASPPQWNFIPFLPSHFLNRSIASRSNDEGE